MSAIPLKHLVDVNQRVLPETTDPEQLIRYIDIGSVATGRLVDEPKQMPFGEAPSRARRLVRDGDTIVSTVRTYLRAVWPVRDSEGLVVSTGFAVLTPRPGLNPRYLGWIAQSDPFVDAIVARSVGVSYPAINPGEIGELRVDPPALEVQRAVSDYLETETARIDDLIAKKRALSDALDERWKRELLHCLGVAHRQDDGPVAWVAELPAGWSLRPLRRLIARSWGGDWGVDAGGAAKDLECVRAADFDFAYLRATAGAIRSFEENTLRSRVLRPGDMVLEKSGGGEGVPVGRVVAWRGDGVAVPTNFAAGVRPAPDADADFVLLTFRAAYQAGLPWRSIKQTTGLQNLDVGHYLTHLWPVPPLEEQGRIAAALLASLEQTQTLQSRLAAQVALLREHRQALITAAVTGELEIPGVAS